MINSNFFKNKKILVTGGAGFIGGAFIERLLYNSEAELINLDKLSYASNLERIEKILRNNNHFSNRYKFLKVDLNNSESIKQIISDVKPNIIINFAAESHVDRSIENPNNFIQSNIVGTFNLLNSTLNYWKSIKNKEKKNDFKFLHISTDEVFGSVKDNKKFDENTPYSPRSPYSASKASSDHLVRAWHHTYGLPTLLTNCSNNYGPWQFPEKLIPLTILKALDNKPIPIYGKGDNIRDWLHVDDHVDGILLVLEKGEIGDSYCIGGHGEKTNLELVQQICSCLNLMKPQNISYSQLITFVNDRPGHDKRYAINPVKIMQELGWKPKYSLEIGIKSTINWYLENIDLVLRIRNQSGYSGNRLGKVSKI